MALTTHECPFGWRFVLLVILQRLGNRIRLSAGQLQFHLRFGFYLRLLCLRLVELLFVLVLVLILLLELVTLQGTG